MLGNNFSNLKFNGLDFWIPGASDGYRILLFGSLNTVVGGGNNGTTVFNLGTGNKITGAKIENEGEFPLGQTITDNYRIIMEKLIKLHKRLSEQISG